MSRMTREDRLLQFAEIVQSSIVPLNCREVSIMAGLKKTPYSRGILRELVDEGTLCVIEDHAWNGEIMYLFYDPCLIRPHMCTR